MPSMAPTAGDLLQKLLSLGMVPGGAMPASAPNMEQTSMPGMLPQSSMPGILPAQPIPNVCTIDFCIRAAYGTENHPPQFGMPVAYSQTGGMHSLSGMQQSRIPPGKTSDYYTDQLPHESKRRRLDLTYLFLLTWCRVNWALLTDYFLYTQEGAGAGEWALYRFCYAMWDMWS